MTEERKRISVSIHDLIRTILRLLPVIICWSLLCCMLLYAYKIIYKKPVYSAEAAIYVLSRTADSDYGRLDVSDLDVSRQMTLDALSILGSEQMAEMTLKQMAESMAPRLLPFMEFQSMFDPRYNTINTVGRIRVAEPIVSRNGNVTLEMPKFDWRAF